MSPPPAIGAAFSGLSAMTASVVRNSAAMDELVPKNDEILVNLPTC